MPKIDMMKNRKIITLHSPGSDFRRELMSIFIFFTLLIERRGLRILNVRRTFRLENWLSYGNNSQSRKEAHTTKKSRMFQESLKYPVL